MGRSRATLRRVDRALEASAHRTGAGIRRVTGVPAVVDAIVVLTSLADVLLGSVDRTVVEHGASLVAVAALLLRRRFPVLAFVLTVPGLWIGSAVVAPVVTLYVLAARSSRLWLLSAAAIVTFFGYGGFLTPPFEPVQRLVVDALYAALVAVGPLAMGALVRTRSELARRIVELRESRVEEQRQAAIAVAEREHAAADAAVARERAQIAREMHDVVAHQVSLVVVHAGAMTMAAPDELTRGFARTVRGLCVATLHELREMVGVLRASGGTSVDASPQPTLDDLPDLVAASGLPVSSDIDLPRDLPAPVQRAVYRFVQEALTNVRKHAPGARVVLHGTSAQRRLVVTVTNDASSEPAMQLPSSGFGLLGLRERAELLGGSIDATPRTDGGYRIRMQLPASHAPAAPRS
jgi:signal transduction histidine kinase